MERVDVIGSFLPVPVGGLHRSAYDFLYARLCAERQSRRQEHIKRLHPVPPFIVKQQSGQCLTCFVPLCLQIVAGSRAALTVTYLPDLFTCSCADSRNDGQPAPRGVQTPESVLSLRRLSGGRRCRGRSRLGLRQRRELPKGGIPAVQRESPRTLVSGMMVHLSGPLHQVQQLRTPAIRVCIRLMHCRGGMIFTQ